MPIPERVERLLPENLFSHLLYGLLDVVVDGYFDISEAWLGRQVVVVSSG
ncbi:MAG TPA: hypothetical protein VE462_02130 [Propionibacteriaceae bacterium]|nr:hypothetical protein [Propionibacteriaceae bacterium]